MNTTFVIHPCNLALGVVNTCIGIVHDIRIPTAYPRALERLRERALATALAYTSDYLAASPVLRGYREIYRSLGYMAPQVVPAAEGLISLIRKRGTLPRINAAVDAYNTVVIDTLVGIGAHDLARVDGPVVFSLATGVEPFTPLGAGRRMTVPRGDFLYRDNTKVLARLAEDDCDQAKLSPDTTDILLVIEGNSDTSLEYTRSAMRTACERITSFCGGAFTITQPRPSSPQFTGAGYTTD